MKDKARIRSTRVALGGSNVFERKTRRRAGRETKSNVSGYSIVVGRIDNHSRALGGIPPGTRGWLIGVEQEKVKNGMKMTQECLDVERDGGADGSNSAHRSRRGERCAEADHGLGAFGE